MKHLCKMKEDCCNSEALATGEAFWATKLIVTFISKCRLQTQKDSFVQTESVNQNHSVELNYKARNFDSKQAKKKT